MKKIKISVHEYEVRVDPFLITTSGNYGMCDSTNQTIYIQADLTPTRLAEVLWHEISHAVWHEYGCADEDIEEAIVTKMSKGQLQVLMDNKHVREVLYV